MYAKFFKRMIDCVLAFVALIVLSPVLLVLTVVGTIVMKGNPFFVQMRPGKKGKNGQEKIFALIKFRTMTCEKDANGILLPDDKRITQYGKLLRATSLDELPELVNIFLGDMAIVGPRPLRVEYLSRYNTEQRRRHDVRVGLTGLAQVSGRNSLSWEERFELDVEYVDNITFLNDIRIIIKTVAQVVKRDGIKPEQSETMEMFMGTEKEVDENE